MEDDTEFQDQECGDLGAEALFGEVLLFNVNLFRVLVRAITGYVTMRVILGLTTSNPEREIAPLIARVQKLMGRVIVRSVTTIRDQFLNIDVTVIHAVLCFDVSFGREVHQKDDYHRE